MKCIRLLPFAAVLLGFAIPAHADVNALSCNRNDVQNALNAAANLDRVFVPAGNCTWTAKVTFPVGRRVSLVGAGVSQTVITINGVTDAVDMGATGSRVTGFHFIRQSGDRIIRAGTANAGAQNFRIDHNRFTNGSNPVTQHIAIYVSGGGLPHPTGVIDHNEFINCRIYLQADLALLAHPVWAQPLLLGAASSGNEVLYVEDNTFNFNVFLGNAIDEQYGGKYVFRNNSVTNALVEVHSMQFNDRGSRSWEIYNNTFHSTLGVFTPMSIRGGTGVAFNNTATGDFSPIRLDNVRSFQSFGAPSGSCNGLSSWDGNASVPGNGWPCRDQIGRSTDAALWTSSNPAPAQASEPAYFWNNTLRGNNMVPVIGNCGSTVKPNGSCADIVAGRDYIASGAQKPGYAPFQYPHPLQLKSWFRPDPPTNLRTP